MALDLDKGVFLRFTHDGIGVAMYAEQPGVFYNEHGHEVSSEIAKSAGFDTPVLLKERRKRELMAQAADAAAKQFDEGPKASEVVKEKSGFQVLHIGMGNHNVLDPDGNVLNKTFLTREAAIGVLNSLVPDKKPEPKKAETVAASA